jgi:ATP/maltotriose-dependent transcriptional regulator MalT
MPQTRDATGTCGCAYLRRAARAMSNPQIAGELHIARSTVDTHLKHPYAKLGIAGRRQLSGALAARVAGLLP